MPTRNASDSHKADFPNLFQEFSLAREMCQLEVYIAFKFRYNVAVGECTVRQRRKKKVWIGFDNENSWNSLWYLYGFEVLLNKGTINIPKIFRNLCLIICIMLSHSQCLRHNHVSFELVVIYPKHDLQFRFSAIWQMKISKSKVRNK